MSALPSTSASAAESSSSPLKPFSPPPPHKLVVREHLTLGVVLLLRPEYEEWLRTVAFIPAPNRVQLDDGQTWVRINSGGTSSFREEEPETRKLRTVVLDELIAKHGGEAQRRKAVEEYAQRWLNYRKWVSTRALHVADEDVEALRAQLEAESEDERSEHRSREVEFDVKKLAQLLEALDGRRDASQWGLYLNWKLKMCIGRGQKRRLWPGPQRFQRAYLYLLSWINRVHVRRLLKQQEGNSASASASQSNSDASEGTGLSHVLATALSGVFSFDSTMPKEGPNGTLSFTINNVVFPDEPCELTIHSGADGSHVACSHCDCDNVNDWSSAPGRCAHALFFLSWLGFKPQELFRGVSPSHLRESLTPPFLHRLRKSWQSFQHPTVPFLDNILTVRLDRMRALSFERLWQACRGALQDLQQLASGSCSSNKGHTLTTPDKKAPQLSLRDDTEWSMHIHTSRAASAQLPLLMITMFCLLLFLSSSICRDEYMSKELIVYCGECRQYWHVGCWKNYKAKAAWDKPLSCPLCRTTPNFFTWESDVRRQQGGPGARGTSSAAGTPSAGAAEAASSPLSTSQLFELRYCEPLQSRRRTRPLPLNHRRPMVLRRDVVDPLMKHDRVWSVSQVQLDGMRKIQVTLHPLRQPQHESKEQLAALHNELVQLVPRGDSQDFCWSTASPTARCSKLQLQSESFGVCATSTLYPVSMQIDATAGADLDDSEQSVASGSKQSRSTSDVPMETSVSLNASMHTPSRGTSEALAFDPMASMGHGHTHSGCATFFFLLYRNSPEGFTQPELIARWRQKTLEEIQQETKAQIGLASNFHVLFPDADLLLSGKDEEMVKDDENSDSSSNNNNREKDDSSSSSNKSENNSDNMSNEETPMPPESVLEYDRHEFHRMVRAVEECRNNWHLNVRAYTPCLGECNINNNELDTWPVALYVAEFDEQIDFAFCQPSELPMQWSQSTRSAILQQKPTFVGTCEQLWAMSDATTIQQGTPVCYRTVRGNKEGMLHSADMAHGPYRNHIAIQPSGTSTQPGDSGSLVCVKHNDNTRSPFAAHRLRVCENAGDLQLAMPIGHYVEALRELLKLEDEYIWVLQ